MIQKIKVYPIQEIYHWISKSIEPFYSWNLISITTTIEESLTNSEKLRLKTMLGCKDILQLQFGDLTPEEISKDSSISKDFLFNKEQAKQIIEFVNTLQKRDSREVLVVHCMAGIARSGAVATFINDILNLDYSRFKRDNPQIRPNSFVLRSLREVSNYWGYEDIAKGSEDDKM